MKYPVSKIVVLAAAVIVAAAWYQPFVSFLEKTKVDKELQEKKNEKDSLRLIVQKIKDDSEEKRRTARNLGYSKQGETMLKIITPDSEKEIKKIGISTILSVSATAVALLVVFFAAVSSKKTEIPKESEESEEIAESEDFEKSENAQT